MCDEMNFEIKPKRGCECFSASIINGLRMQGFELSGSDVMFSMGEKQLIYYEKRKRACILSCKSFLEQYGFSGCKNWEGGDVRDFFRKEINNGDKNVIFCVRPEYLEYFHFFNTEGAGYSHYVNFLKADEEGIHLVDGYCYNLRDEPKIVVVDYDKFARAWKEHEYLYYRLTIPEGFDVNVVKEDARKKFLLYLKNSHELIMQSRSGRAKEEILLQFQMFIESIRNNEMSERQEIDVYMSNLKVKGFFVVKNYILEKIEEMHPERKDEYAAFITRWTQYMLVLRKYYYRGKIDSICGLYDDILELSEDEDQFLMTVFGEEIKTT